MPTKKQKIVNISGIDDLNRLQSGDPAYIHSGVPTKFSKIKQDDLLWAIAVDNSGLNHSKSLIKVLSVDTHSVSDLKINFNWIVYTTPPWNERRYIIITQKDKDTPIYEHKYITDVYADNTPIHSNQVLTLHKVFKTNNNDIDPNLRGIKFVHTDDVNYLANLEQRTTLLQLAKSVTTHTPYHLLGSIKLSAKIGSKATLDSRGIISHIMPRQQEFPLNIVPCNSPTFEHEDHWYRYVQYYQLNDPISDANEYITKFRKITGDNVYSEHFYSNPGPNLYPNLYIDGNGAKAPTETLGVVTLNCYNKDIISIMKSHEKVFKVSTVILLQEASGLTLIGDEYEHLKRNDKWTHYMQRRINLLRT